MKRKKEIMLAMFKLLIKLLFLDKLSFLEGNGGVRYIYIYIYIYASYYLIIA
jgi:hypothetical protein